MDRRSHFATLPLFTSAATASHGAKLASWSSRISSFRFWSGRAGCASTRRHLGSFDRNDQIPACQLIQQVGGVIGFRSERGSQLGQTEAGSTAQLGGQEESVKSPR